MWDLDEAMNSDPVFLRPPGQARERVPEHLRPTMPFNERMSRVQGFLDEYGRLLGQARFTDRGWLSKCDQVASNIRLVLYPVLDSIAPEQGLDPIWPDALRNFGLLIAASDMALAGVRARDVGLINRSMRLMDDVGQFSRYLAERLHKGEPAAGEYRPNFGAVDAIAELANLHAHGILTDDEFSTKKRELIERI